ncbi:MAG: phosphatidylinositol-specific phospholipase C domain-containing protein [Clostridia bacterium]|nr:phosphatidylinositol-specific phospholipase C domain-containing protein [Clostridia bacterium]
MKTFLKILGGILLGLLAVLLIAVVILFSLPYLESTDETAVEGSQNWMKDLDDALSLSDVVLPGTHDTGTTKVDLAFFSRCQTLDIRGQLDAGFRYLDIRLGGSPDAFDLVHGFTKCRTGLWPWSSALTVESVLSDVESFLIDNPTECVLFVVKRESNDFTDEEMISPLLTVVRSILKDRFLETDSIPTVGEARGKMILLVRTRSNEGAAEALSYIPFFLPDMPDSSLPETAYITRGFTWGTLTLQDKYELEAENKWTAFTQTLQAENDVILNFLSTKGSATYGHPYVYASTLNERLLSSGVLNDVTKGWIILDFGTPKLAQAVYSCNFS